MSTSASIERHYGVVSADELRALSGLEFLQGLVTGALPLNTMARTLAYNIAEAIVGRVIVTADPSGDHLNPAGTVHDCFAATLLSAVRCRCNDAFEGIATGLIAWTADAL